MKAIERKSEKGSVLGLGQKNPLGVALLGEEVGKTAALTRVMYDEFLVGDGANSEFPVAFRHGILYLSAVEVYTSEGYTTHRAHQLASCHVALLMFSVADRQSFEKLGRHYESTKAIFGERDVPFIVVGTCTDLVAERQVTFEEGKAYADTIGSTYMEMSSKTGEGVRSVFDEAIKQARANDQLQANQVHCTIQ